MAAKRIDSAEHTPGTEMRLMCNNRKKKVQSTAHFCHLYIQWLTVSCALFPGSKGLEVNCPLVIKLCVICYV